MDYLYLSQQKLMGEGLLAEYKQLLGLNRGRYDELYGKGKTWRDWLFPWHGIPAGTPQELLDQIAFYEEKVKDTEQKLAEINKQLIKITG